LIAGAINVHLDATEYADRIVFLHAVKPGPASRSYGLQVAALAGVPQPVIEAARQKMNELENRERRPETSSVHSTDRPAQGAFLFGQEDPALRALATELAKTDVDGLTPRDALSRLYALRDQAKKLV